MVKKAVNTKPLYDVVMTVKDMLIKDISQHRYCDSLVDAMRMLCKDAHTRRYWLAEKSDSDHPAACIESAVWAERDQEMYVVVCDDYGHHHMLQTGKKIPSVLAHLKFVVAASAYSEKVQKVRRKYSRNGDGSYLDDSLLVARLVELGEGD